MVLKEVVYGKLRKPACTKSYQTTKLYIRLAIEFANSILSLSQRQILLSKT